METKHLNPEGVFDPKAFGMSQGMVDLGTGLVFVSGQVAWDVEGKVVGNTHAEQTRRALQNLIAVLDAAARMRRTCFWCGCTCAASSPRTPGRAFPCLRSTSEKHVQR